MIIRVELPLCGTERKQSVSECERKCEELFLLRAPNGEHTI